MNLAIDTVNAELHNSLDDDTFDHIQQLVSVYAFIMYTKDVLYDCAFLFINFLVGPPVILYRLSSQFSNYVNTKVDHIRSAYPRILEWMSLAVLWYLLVIPLCSISIGITAWKLLLGVRWRFHLRKTWEFLSDIRIVTASAQENKLQAELSKLKDILHAQQLVRENNLHVEHLARESILRDEHAAKTTTLRNELAEQRRKTDIARQRSDGPRQIRKQTASKFFHPPTAATACPGIFVPTMVDRPTVSKPTKHVRNSTQTIEVTPAEHVRSSTQTIEVKPAEYVSNSTQTMEVKPAEHVSNSTQTMEVKPAYVHAATHTDSEIQPQPQQPKLQQPIPTKTATFSFSSIKAAHTIVPEPVYKRPAIETTDAGVQADSTDLVWRKDLSTQAERHDSEIAALKSSHLSERREQLRAQKERHDTETANVKLAYSNEITNLKSSQSTGVAAAQKKLALYEQEGIKLQAMVNNLSSSHAVMEAHVQGRDDENARLVTELEAAKAKVAAGASKQEVEDYVKKMQGECANQMAVKDSDCERKLKVLRTHVERSEADRKKAEADARIVPGLRQQIAKLEKQANVGQWPGLTTPSDGSRKNAAKLEQELEQAKKERDHAQAGWQHAHNAAKETGETLAACDRARLDAIAKLDEAQRDLARYKPTVMPEPSLNTAAGGKRGAQDQMTRGAGKRAR